MQTRRLAPFIAACHLLGCAAAELPDKPMPKPYELSQMDFPLKSGMRVLVQEDHSAPVVAVVVTFNVGSTSDPKGEEGLAHFVEHLAFRTKFSTACRSWIACSTWAAGLQRHHLVGLHQLLLDRAKDTSRS
jgi:zinc protease